jgi:hypothetical protein
VLNLIQAEKVREIVSSLTKAKFEVTNPGRYPLPAQSVKWFLNCPEITEAREIPYLNVIWAGGDAEICFDSLPLGNTTSWIEASYGEEAAGRSMSVNYSDFRTSRLVLDKEFPITNRRIETCEKITHDISVRKGIPVEIFVHGREGRATFRLRARLSLARISESNIRVGIESVIETMKEVWEAIQKLES